MKTRSRVLATIYDHSHMSAIHAYLHQRPYTAVWGRLKLSWKHKRVILRWVLTGEVPESEKDTITVKKV